MDPYRVKGSRLLKEDGKTAAGRKTGAGQLTVLFDGNCPVCQASVRRLEGWAPEGTLELLDNRDPCVSERFPWLGETELSESLHVIGPGGETWEGAPAIERLIKALPGFRRGSWVFRLPLVRPLASRIYSWVAANRYR